MRRLPIKADQHQPRQGGKRQQGDRAIRQNGVHGRVTAGLLLRAPNGLTLTANGSYDGIGLGDDDHAISATLGLSLPF